MDTGAGVELLLSKGGASQNIYLICSDLQTKLKQDKTILKQDITSYDPMLWYNSSSV